MLSLNRTRQQVFLYLAFGRAIFPGLAIGLMLLCMAKPVTAAEQSSREAVRTCTQCHDETGKNSVAAIFHSKHAVMADTRSPFADQACVSCHGPSEAHRRGVGPEGRQASPDVVFKPDSDTPVAARNTVCLTCHESSSRMHWQGSAHEFQNLTCSSCHTTHTEKDRVLEKKTQPEVCFDCHKNQRAQISRPSSHPIREGKVTCSDCHNPHGTTGPKLLEKSTVNETCYTCHAEKRGPFLWEHAPAREDCTICHQPHGSVHESLLKNRAPWLCQQCHLAQFHPSTAYSGTGLPGPTVPSGAQQMLGKNCMNCHSQVHGSNHPSGPRKTR